MYPKISVITINLNDAKGLQKTIESVINQDFSDFEHLVVDGASTDGSAELIKKYEDKITYWVSEPDTGIYNAMNKGIAMSRGNYCLFLNSGDFLSDKDVLSKVYSFNPEEDIVFGNIMVDHGDHIKPVVYNDKITLKVLFKDSLPHPATFIKKALFEKIGYYDESFRIAGDYEFFLRALVSNKCSYKHIDPVITVYNTRGISSQRKFLDLNLKESRQAQNIHFSPEVVELFHDLNNEIMKLVGDLREVEYDYNVLLKSRPVRYAKFLRKIFSSNNT